jgi:hypothetical protein
MLRNATRSPLKLLLQNAGYLNYVPALFIEIHGVTEEAKLENVQGVVEFLDSCTYTIDHVESGQTISTTTAYIAKGGHIYCTQTALLDC